MRILMIFIDGIGLGDADPGINPFAIAETPHLISLSAGRRWLRDTGPQTSARASFVPTDPRMGVDGRPQSATGQAAILTGINVPKVIGEHYGPKPNAPIRDLLARDNLFNRLVNCGRTAALIEAYPPRWHETVNRGKQLRASYQQAAHEAGLPIFGKDDLYAGRALSGDWTGEGWRTQLGFADAPVYTPHEAGAQMVRIARGYDFTFFSHWMTDLIGHRGPLSDAVALLERFDGVMAGVLDTWDDDEGLVVITSDHGNMEHIGDRHHTENDIPTVIIGREHHRYAHDFRTLADHAPRIEELLLTSA